MPALPADRPAWAALAEPEFVLLVRQILAELTVAAERWEGQAAVPAEVWRELGDRGLLGLGYPERFGAPLGRSVAFLTELGRTGYAGFRAAVGVHAYMANRYPGEYADAKLQQRHLAPALAGRRIAGLAITEPDAGSDLTGLAASTEPDGRFGSCASQPEGHGETVTKTGHRLLYRHNRQPRPAIGLARHRTNMPGGVRRTSMLRSSDRSLAVSAAPSLASNAKGLDQ